MFRNTTFGCALWLVSACASDSSCLDMGAIKGAHGLCGCPQGTHVEMLADQRTVCSADLDAQASPGVLADAATDGAVTVSSAGDAASVGVVDASPSPPERVTVDGSADDGGPPVNGAALPQPRPLFVVVGDSELRMVSFDLGKTWPMVMTNGPAGQNEHWLHGVTFGQGLVVAVGKKIWSSPDARTWTEHVPPAQWLSAVRHGNGLFVAVGGLGTTLVSSDGTQWAASTGRSDQETWGLAFGNGVFTAATPNAWWTSSDGNDWMQQPGARATENIVWCKDHFSDPAQCDDPLARNRGITAYGEGVYVSVTPEGDKIERSDNGTDWQVVLQPSTSVWAVAFGYL
ncbi:MAG: hypothetical protein JWN04_1350 [Myxococcaceae bacterium]|nr:hypothetical protein [Myxococcaceae bacterium]